MDSGFELDLICHTTNYISWAFGTFFWRFEADVFENSSGGVKDIFIFSCADVE